jgi:excisionase family DNA binding protein
MPVDPFAVLDALPLERVPAAIAHFSARLLTAPTLALNATDLLTPEQVAALLQTSKRYVYRHSALLGATRVSDRKLRFRRSAVDAYLKARTR